MKAKRAVIFKTEAELCAAFIDWAKGEGYRCYPETAGFDILLVDPDNFQTGIEAKLRFNVTVITQALPRFSADVGPDYRAVLVPELVADWKDLCGHVGLEVFSCMRRYDDRKPHRFARYPLNSFDWNPHRRCELPEYMPDVPAGVPAPVQLTPWKISALRILAHIAITGSITRRQVSVYGCDCRRWCSGDSWLEPLSGDPRRGGRWIRGAGCPRFDEQHPDVYAQIKAELISAGTAPDQRELAVA